MNIVESNLELEEFQIIGVGDVFRHLEHGLCMRIEKVVVLNIHNQPNMYYSAVQLSSGKPLEIRSDTKVLPIDGRFVLERN